MAMTYVDGETLEDYLAREGALDEYDALQIGLKISNALKYAWENHQILHRDIKPDNIMIDQAKIPKLLDMGISKNLGEEGPKSTSTGFLVGTPHYMSPEQARGDDALDFRSDMYSLGCTIYHVVSGQVPFDGENVADVLHKHALAPFSSPKNIKSEISNECVELLRVMMSKSPAERHASWDELIKDIRRVMKGQMPRAAKASGRLGEALVEPFDEFFLVVKRYDNAALYLRRLGGMVTYVHIQ